MKKFLMLALAFVCFHFAMAQDSSTLLSSVAPKLFENIFKVQEKAADKIQKQNEKLLKLMVVKEEKIYRQLSAYDSIKTKDLFAGVSSKYATLEKKISDPSSLLDANKSSQYIPRMDSLKTMLNFLKPLSNNKEQVDKALTSVEALKTKLTQAQDIKSFLTEREAALKSIVQTYTKLPAGLVKSIGKYSKECYYYKERVAGWKQELNNPQKIEQTALQLLNKLPAFKAFWQQNSELASLFGNSAGALPSLAGLQTRQSVMQELQQRFGGAAINPEQMLQQNLASAQNELSKLKSKADNLLQGGAVDDNTSMPGFNPNSQKAKPFLKRLEYGFNLQTCGKPVRNLPDYHAVNDLALSVGYKLSDRLIAGIGVAYKFGLGRDWKHLNYTHEGLGLRGFVDLKITSRKTKVGSLFSNLSITSGYERNYISLIQSTGQENRVYTWQSSCLIGATKIIATNGKLLKHTKMQLLWDVLSYQHFPSTKPILFRIGYNF